MADTSHPPILVVDDNPDNAHIIRDYLEARGYPITVAYNEDDALRAFEEVKPALVLLDSKDRPLRPLWTHMDRRARPANPASRRPLSARTWSRAYGSDPVPS